MANIKTAISMGKPLFEQVDALAHELEISRSHLFVLAAREFIQRHKNQKLLDAINAAYADLPDSEEQTIQRHMQSRHRELVEDQW